MTGAVGARAAQDDDGRRNHGRAVADPLEPGTGSEEMRRIAVPMVGGMISSTILTLLVIPAIYEIVKGWRLPQEGARSVTGHAPVASAAE